MDLYLHFILVNSEFNIGLATDFYDGQESEDNIKHLWEDEMLVSEPVKDFKIKNNAIYKLAGYYPDNSEFSFDIWDMTIMECNTESGNLMQFAVSKKLLKNTEKVVDEKTGDTHLYFYLKDALPLENPMDGVYIVRSDFPKELRMKNSKS